MTTARDEAGTPPGTTAERLAARGPVAVAAREATLAVMAAEPFDIVVIGGGITGAGVAREAALAGYRTALVERHDFAFGTSSRSSRLIHGGVRYLEHGHIGLVFESSRERRLLLDLARHLVRPLAFTWPVYRDARIAGWKVRAGLTMYDALSLFRNMRHRWLDAHGVVSYEPELGRDGLRGGARYWDAATDDTRLTLSAALSARDAGAVVANHLDVIGGMRAGADGRLTGVTVRDTIGDATFTIAGHVVLNATGPWSDATAAITGAATGPTLHGSVGTHVAIPRHRIGNRDAITLVSPLDGRVMFILPAGPHALVGTTERPAREGPDRVRATEQEISYLLRSVNACCPYANLSRDDVVSAWAGIRPLAAARSGERSANAASREHAITHRDDGLVSVTGGKLTTFRAMAADVLAHAVREAADAGGLPAPSESAQASTRTALHGGDFVSREFLEQDARDTTHDAAVGERLAQAYGSHWRNVWSYAQRDPSLALRLVADLPYLVAEVPHAVERELACTLGDVLIRRTHIAFETRDNGRGVARRIVPLMAALLDWSAAEQERQLAAYDSEVDAMFTVEAPR